MTTVFLRALICGYIFGTSSAFVKEALLLGLCCTDGNIWPSKNSNGPLKMLKGPNMALKMSDLGTTLKMHNPKIKQIYEP